MQEDLHHLVYEIVDNSVDEALQDLEMDISVKIHEDQSITFAILDVVCQQVCIESGNPTAEVIFTVLHAGGKFGQGGYKTSGGLHGVGASVVNALSSFVEVII